MIHPVFAHIEDPQMAKTCSEIFTGDYRYVQDDEEAESFGKGEALLTNPQMEFLSVQICYLEEEPSGGLWSPIKFATLGPKLPPRSDVMEKYKRSVGHCQRLGTTNSIVAIMSSIPRFGNQGWPAVREWFSERVAQTGNALLAAYILGRSLEDGTLTDTLTYPRHVQQQMGLLVREVFMEGSSAKTDEVPTAIREILIHNERIYEFLGDIAASNQLLSPETFDATAGPYLRD